MNGRRDSSLGGGGRQRGAAPATPKVSRPTRCQVRQRLATFAAVRAALEEVVALFRGHRQQAELCEARIGIDHEGVRAGAARLQFVPGARRSRRCRAAVGHRGVARCADRRRRAQSSARPDEHDSRVGEALLGGVQQHAGDGHVGAQSDAREHEDGPTRAGSRRGRRTRRSAPANPSASGRAIAPDDRLRKQSRVDVAQRRLEAVGQALHQDAEERVGQSGVDESSRSIVRRSARPRAQCSQ